MCIFSLSYTACKAREPYYIVICGFLRLHRIFPHYLINGTIFVKKLLIIKFLFWFSVHILSEIILILRRVRKYVIINVYRFSCKVTCILVRLSWILNFFDRFSKITPMCNFIKIRPMGPEMFYADRERNGKTDGRMDEQTWGSQ